MWTHYVARICYLSSSHIWLNMVYSHNSRLYFNFILNFYVLYQYYVSICGTVKYNIQLHPVFVSLDLVTCMKKYGLGILPGIWPNLLNFKTIPYLNVYGAIRSPDICRCICTQSMSKVFVLMCSAFRAIFGQC